MKETTKMVQDGIGYIRNHGDSPSYLKSAFDNFTEASRLGDAIGMNCLGTCYERGYGCIKDYQKAHFWWKRAADLGHIDAMFCVAFDYYKGRGTGSSYVKSERYMSMAKESGQKSAAQKYDLWFSESEAEKDSREGRELAIKSSQGDVSATLDCAVIYYQTGDYYTVLELCRGLYKDYSNPDAAALLGLVCEKRSGGRRFDLVIANNYFGESLKHGGPSIPYLQLCVAEFLRKWWQEYSVEDLSVKDEDDLMASSFDWYLKAARSGLTKAQTLTGLCYRDATGVEKNLQEAAYWFESASEFDALAACAAGLLYYSGNGVLQDYGKAFSLFSKGYDVDPKDGTVLYYLGVCHYNGHGTDVDVLLAENCFREAVALGCEDAREGLSAIENSR